MTPVSAIRTDARRAGLLYLLLGVTAPIGLMVVPGRLIVLGDAAATMERIRTSEGLFRIGIASELFHQALAVFLVLALYRLFRPVHATLARLALLFGMVSLVIEAVALLHVYVPLAVIEEGPALAGLGGQQLEALAYLATQLFSTGWAFGLLHFGGFCVATGLLILRSRLIPRAIGAMLIVAGVCYPINSLTFAFMRDLSDVLVPWILLPVLVAELSFAGWLAVKGVRTFNTA